MEAPCHSIHLGTRPLIPMRAIPAVFLLVLVLSPAAYSQATSTLTRDTEAVVLRGSELVTLLGTALGDIVAFKYDGDGLPAAEVLRSGRS